MLRFPRFVIWLLNAYRWSKSVLNYVVKFLHIERFFAWIKKHQKLTAWGSSVIMGFSLNTVMDENKELIQDKHRVDVLQERLKGKNATRNDFDLPWYKKVKKGRNFRITGFNDAYQNYYGLDVRSLGKTNYEIAPEDIADEWRKTDSTVVKDWISVDRIERAKINDSLIIPVMTHKWPGTDRLDTLVYGISVPISKLIAVIDKKGNIEVLEIVPDSLEK